MYPEAKDELEDKPHHSQKDRNPQKPVDQDLVDSIGDVQPLHGIEPFPDGFLYQPG